MAFARGSAGSTLFNLRPCGAKGMRAGSGGGAWKYQTSMGPNQCLPECSAFKGYLVEGMRDEPTRLSALEFDAVHRHAAVPVLQFSLASTKNVWFDDDDGLAFCTGACLSDDVQRPGLPDQLNARRDPIHMQRNDVIARIHPLVSIAPDAVALPRRDDSETAPGTTGALACVCQINQ